MAKINLGPTDILGSSGQPTGRNWPANLTNTNFKGAMLEDAKLMIANLRNACLDGANLVNADLTDAVTDGASFDGAELAGAKMPE